MKAELKNNISRRPKFTVIRNPALLPARLGEQGFQKVLTKRKDNSLVGKKMKMPDEPTGYIKCRKHDFL